MSGNDLQRSIDRACWFGLAAVCGVLIDMSLIAMDLFWGSTTSAFVPAVALAAFLLLVVIQMRVIRSYQRTRELNRRADELELAAQAARARLSSCTHPHAEPVDLSTGERVAWVCPDCPAELPAGWAPAKVKGTLTASGGAFSVTASLSGASILSAKARQAACDCDSRIEVHTFEDGSPVASYCSKCGRGTWHRPVAILSGTGTLSAWDDVAYASEASQHFAQLARVGLKHCLSYCPICAGRSQS